MVADFMISTTVYPDFQAGCREDATFDFITPVDCSREQLEEWLRFHLGVIGSISQDNPLAEFDLDVESVFII